MTKKILEPILPTGKKGTTKKHRSASQIERDRRRISEMYLRGELQADIAKELSLSQSTISNDLAAIQEEWKLSSLMDFDKRKAQELAKVDDLEREYWGAWKRSYGVNVKRSKKATKKMGDTIQEAGETEESLLGDPRFLAGVQWCINKRCELMGLDAPKKSELTGKDGKPLLPEQKVTDEEYNRTLSSLALALDEISLGEAIPGAGSKADGGLDSTKS